MSPRGTKGHRQDSEDWDSEGEPIARTPRRVRQKGPPRYAPHLSPGPGIDLDYAPFSTVEVEALILKVDFPLAAGQTTALVMEQLNLHALSRDLWVELDRQPTARAVINELEELERCARQLQAKLPLLPVPGDHDERQSRTTPAHGLVWPLRHHLPDAMADRIRQLRRETRHKVQRKGFWIQEEDTSLTEETLFGATNAEDLLTILSEGAGALATACAAAVHEAEQLSRSETRPAEASTALKNTVHDLLRLYTDFFGRKAVISKEGTTNRPIGPTLRFLQGALKVMGVETSDENILRIYRQESKASPRGGSRPIG